MEEQIKELIEKWLKRSKQFHDVASQRFSFGDWQMGNVDAASASAYKTAALQLQELLDKHG
jgi:hypothetical protein